MEENGRKAPAARMRLSAEKRERFLEVLGQTGNRKAAAEAIGVEPRLMDQRRQFDPLLDRQWDEALDQADRRLAGANGPLDCVGGRRLNVIKRGRGGRRQIVASGPKRWNGEIEDRFFAALSACGTIAAAARAVGFSESCIYQRRRQWPGFERRFEDALDDAELSIEFELATAANDPAAARDRGRAQADGGSAPEGAGARPRLDPDLALRFLKWREQKRRSGGPRRGPGPRPPSIEEARESILRKIAAIERHQNRRRLAEGWSQDEEGRMIPPGWVRRDEAER